MSFVIATPEFVSAAAGNLADIGSELSAAHASAALPTTRVVAAAEDEISAAIAGTFSTFGEDFQAVGANAAAYHAEFVSRLNSGAASYLAAEAANAQQTLASSFNASGVVGAAAVSPASLLGGLLGGGSGGSPTIPVLGGLLGGGTGGNPFGGLTALLGGGGNPFGGLTALLGGGANPFAGLTGIFGIGGTGSFGHFTGMG
jgi:hypothetical protein